jgi:very-short-patch-repair endonuclease
MVSNTQSPLDFARALRNNPTRAEARLWTLLSRLRPRFTRQLRLGPFVADFACRRARLIVEVDGSQHAESNRDERRTAALAADGWRVLRFWNSDVADNVDGVVEAIVAAVAVRLPFGETVEFVGSRAGRERKPRAERRKEPPPAPPASAGGEV